LQQDAATNIAMVAATSERGVLRSESSRLGKRVASLARTDPSAALLRPAGIAQLKRVRWPV